MRCWPPSQRALGDADVVVLSDYAKGVLCDGVLDAILARAQAAGPAGDRRPQAAGFRRLPRRDRADARTSSRSRVATRIDASHDAEAERAGRPRWRRPGGEAVLVTALRQGPDPGAPRRDRRCTCRPGRAKWPTCPAPATRWSPPWRWRWLPGPSCRQAAMLANITAGISVGKQGTATVTRPGAAGRAASARPGRHRPQGGDLATRRLRHASPPGTPLGCGSASPMAAST